jgi:hypothetical protein
VLAFEFQGESTGRRCILVIHWHACVPSKTTAGGLAIHGMPTGAVDHLLTGPDISSLQSTCNSMTDHYCHCIKLQYLTSTLAWHAHIMVILDIAGSACLMSQQAPFSSFRDAGLPIFVIVCTTARFKRRAGNPQSAKRHRKYSSPDLYTTL